MRLFLHSGFDVISGYGNTATNLAIELNNLGVDVYPICDGVGLGMPEEFTKLLQKKNPIREHIDFYIKFNTPKISKLKDNFKFIEHKIFFTMWEQTRLTNDFGKRRFDDYDMLWVPCKMNVDVFKNNFNKDIYVVPLGVDNKTFSEMPRDLYSKELNVCVNGALSYRKGVDILIDVMLDERIKKLPIKFNIKNSQQTTHPGLSKLNPNIKLYEGIFDTTRIKSLYSENDVMLCLSRGEGYNQPAVEFICTGGVVITHNWGGHSIWANDEYCELLPYELVKVKNWENVHKDSVWAEVAKEDVVNSLIKLYNDRKRLNKLSMNALKVKDFFGFDAMAENVLSFLEGIYYDSPRASVPGTQL
jgi:glycosyltransferase involved in cell wall biosynthesis